eukprot:Tamp_12759.p1 GENE.Tamp_12759~~Tamp_12759.p1  ORF type:complete len:438 (+),score=68.37 Tamp_12759:22-1314(+)
MYGERVTGAVPPAHTTYASSMFAGPRANASPATPLSSHAMYADLGGIWGLAQQAQAQAQAGHETPGCGHHAIGNDADPPEAAARGSALPHFTSPQHSPAAGSIGVSCAQQPPCEVLEQREAFGGTVSAQRRAKLDLLCSALHPRDHTHELLRKAVSSLGLPQSQHRKHSVQLLSDDSAYSAARGDDLRSDSSVSSSASFCSSFSSISAGPSMCMGPSLPEAGEAAGGMRRIASMDSMLTSRISGGARRQVKDKREPTNVIYPRRKVGQDMRNANHVVVTAEILEQHFDMPLHDAATKLGLCATAIKKACRRFGILRWPFRDRHRISARPSSDDLTALEARASAQDGVPSGASNCLADAITIAERPGAASNSAAHAQRESTGGDDVPMVPVAGAAQNSVPTGKPSSRDSSCPGGPQPTADDKGMECECVES